MTVLAPIELAVIVVYPIMRGRVTLEAFVAETTLTLISALSDLLFLVACWSFAEEAGSFVLLLVWVGLFARAELLVHLGLRLI